MYLAPNIHGISKVLEKDLDAKAINIANVKIDHKKPLTDTAGNSIGEGLEFLSRVGLNGASLSVRRYSELRDGQGYRYRLAKLLKSGKQSWVMDKFYQHWTETQLEL